MSETIDVSEEAVAQWAERMDRVDEPLAAAMLRLLREKLTAAEKKLAGLVSYVEGEKEMAEQRAAESEFDERYAHGRVADKLDDVLVYAAALDSARLREVSNG